MSINELNIEVSDAMNPKVLRIFDTSHYCNEDITNYLIEILPVNKTRWVTFHVQKSFSLVTNSSSLGYGSVTDEAGLRDLPDGIYEIKQSYKPNIETVVHYYHLRTVALRKKIQNYWNNLKKDTCRITREEFHNQREKLREIDEYVLGAKYKVEECGEKKEGKEMYEWAIKLLERYGNECQC